MVQSYNNEESTYPHKMLHCTTILYGELLIAENSDHAL